MLPVGDTTAKRGLLLVRLVLVVVGVIYLVAAVAGGVEGLAARLLGVSYGVVLVATGALLSGDRRWAYRIALADVALGIVVDVATGRVIGLVIYAVLLAILLMPANRAHWLPNGEARQRP